MKYCRTDAIIWVNPEDVMLSGKSESKKATYCKVPFIGNVQNRQIHSNSRLLAARS